jgi:glycosyltransferase involved in cell wall biosynthesis
MANQSFGCLRVERGSFVTSTQQHPGRLLMTGTFGLRPKGTMSARAAGIASALQQRGWSTRIITVPWDYSSDAGTITSLSGVPVVNTRFVHPLLWPLPVAQIIREAQRFKPDIVHLFKPKGFGDLAVRFLKWAGFPVVVDMDDWEGDRGWNDVLAYGPVQRSLFDWQERTWPSMADGVTVASRTLEQRAVELGASSERILYVPNLLTCERFNILSQPRATPTRRYAIPGPRTRNILLYTRFVEFQPEFLVRMMSLILRRVPDAHLVIAGKSADGHAEEVLRTASRTAGIAQRFVHLGWIDPDDLGWIAQQCHAAVVPFDDSLVNRAKCSVKLLELIACGMPIVASNVGENREYLNRHCTGLLARPGDADHHAERLLEAFSVPQTHREHHFESHGPTTGDVVWSSAAKELEQHYLASAENAIRRRDRRFVK